MPAIPSQLAMAHVGPQSTVLRALDNSLLCDMKNWVFLLNVLRHSQIKTRQNTSSVRKTKKEPCHPSCSNDKRSNFRGTFGFPQIHFHVYFNI